MSLVQRLGKGASIIAPDLLALPSLTPSQQLETMRFFCCTGLTSVAIPSSVTTIGEWCFSDCTGLTSIDIPNSVTTIGTRCFNKCTNLTNIDIPNSVTTLGDEAFYLCTELTSVAISNSVTTIGQLCFASCRNLTSIVIPNSVITIGTAAFSGSGLTSIVIPNSVTTIKSSAFSGCTGLTSVVLSNSVKTIEIQTFYECTGLTSISIPGSVTTIGHDAFFHCIGLKKLVFEDNEEDLMIDEDAFNYCLIEELYLGRNLTVNQLDDVDMLTDVTIGSLVTDVTAVLWSSNRDLVSIKSLATTPPTTREFTDAQYKNINLSVPAGSLDKYKEDAIWKNFFNIQEDTSTGISNVVARDGQGVKVENGNIVVDNAKGRVSVYDVAGTLINSVKAEGNRVEIAVPGSGVYIVRAGGKSVKVAM